MFKLVEFVQTHLLICHITTLEFIFTHTNSVLVGLNRKLLLMGKYQLIVFSLNTGCSCRATQTHTGHRHIHRDLLVF